MRIGKLTGTIWLVVFASMMPPARAADIRISDLPLGTATGTGTNDSFPYVDAIGGTTRRLKLSDIKNVPSMVGQYAPLNNPVFTGTVTAPTFIGALTGNASTATALAADPTDCGANTFAVSIDSHGNLTCSSVPDAALASSYVYADGTRGLTGAWNAGQSITAPTFIGALTGNASTASALAANPTDCGANTVATSIDAQGNLGCVQVGNSTLVNMSAHTFKGNNTGSSGPVLDLTATQLTAEINLMVGDSGSGGTKGLAPAPGAGDAAAGKYLKSDGNWAVPPGTVGANTTLSNLGTTAVNADLLPDGDGTRELGSASARWDSLFTKTIKGTSGNTAVDVTARQLSSTSGVPRFDFSGALALGLGAIGIKESGGNFFALILPTGASGYNWNLPMTQGAASTLLENDGAGNLSWVAAPTGGGGSPAVITGQYFVDGTNGNDSTGDGSIEKPWATLTLAESTLGSVCNSTFICRLHIAPGTYAEGGATTMAWHPWVYIEGSGNDSSAVSFDGIDFQPFGVSGGFSMKMSGITVGSITAGSFPGGATITLDHIFSSGDVNLSHRFQHQIITNSRFDGSFLAQGDTVHGTTFVRDVEIAGDFVVDQTTSGGAEMDLDADHLQVGSNLTFGHTEPASLMNVTVGGLAITSATGRIITITTNTQFEGITQAPNTGHFVFNTRVPDEVAYQAGDFVDDGVARIYNIDTSGGPVEITVLANAYRPFPLKIVNTGGNQVHVVVNGGGTIEGLSNEFINGRGYIEIQGDGTAGNNYVIMSQQRTIGLREKTSSTALSSTFATVVWDVEDENTFGTETLPGTFTADTAGHYQVNAAVQISGTFVLNSELDMAVAKNGVAMAEDDEFAAGAVTDMSAHVSDVITLAAGDTVRVQVRSISSTSPAFVANAAKNHFSMIRVAD